MQNLTICEFSYKQIQTIVCVCVSVLIGGYPCICSLYIQFIRYIYGKLCSHIYSFVPDLIHRAAKSATEISRTLLLITLINNRNSGAHCLKCNRQHIPIDKITLLSFYQPTHYISGQLLVQPNQPIHSTLKLRLSLLRKLEEIAG